MNRAPYFLASLIAVALAAPAQAYYIEAVNQVDGGAEVPIRYDSSTAVQFRIHTAGMPSSDGSEFAAIVAAFQTWTDVTCADIAFEEGPREATARARHWTEAASPRFIFVYWSNDAALFPTPMVGFFDWAHDGTGTLIGGQIILNSRHHSWSTTGAAGSIDVQGTVTALLGRVLGITSNMEGNATYPRYAPGDISKRTLGTDDIAAIQYLYNDGSCTPADPEMVCGMMTPMCPPPVVIPMTDGGVIPGVDSGVIPGVDSGVIPGVDSGVIPGVDSGVTPGTDGGGTPPGGDDGGCCSVAAGAPRPAGPGLIAMAALGLAVLLRRRHRRR